MIDLYTWPTPNGHKVQIMLEEVGVPYDVHPVDITEGAQFDAAYLALNPNNKVPTIVDRDGPDGAPYVVFETGAILMYLAEKTGRFLPREMAARYEVIQWLMFQMGNIGPMFGQAVHYRQYAYDEHAYSIERYTRECARLMRIMEHRLGERDFLAGEYSIADIACFPWIRLNKWAGVELKGYPAVDRWYGTIRARPAVDRGLKLLRDNWKDIRTSDVAKENLFGASQYRAH